ncbi:hypothetical protein WN48_00573 [Eufriesea mexicana]|nr:hypothetical protein WN48_00573 [Eufriesea mexicana]
MLPVGRFHPGTDVFPGAESYGRNDDSRATNLSLRVRGATFIETGETSDRMG